jgi:excisionase family DNA binding protein
MAGAHAKVSDDRLAVSVPEAARLLGISAPLVWKMVARSEIRTVKVRRRRLVPMAELQRLVSADAD